MVANLFQILLVSLILKEITNLYLNAVKFKNSSYYSKITNR